MFKLTKAQQDLVDHIRVRRIEKHLRQSDLADELGVSDARMSQLMNHPSEMRLDSLMDLNDLLELDPGVLLRALSTRETTIKKFKEN